MSRSGSFSYLCISMVAMHGQRELIYTAIRPDLMRQVCALGGRRRRRGRVEKEDNSKLCQQSRVESVRSYVEEHCN